MVALLHPADGSSGGKPILTLNGGSSSIKFAWFQPAKDLQRELAGSLDRLGLPGTKLTYQGAADQATQSQTFPTTDHATTVNQLLDWLAAHINFADLQAVGHRVVHGMQHSQPARVTPELLRELRSTSPYDPEHLPREIELIEAIGRCHPQLPQWACFDTSFHHDLPRLARMLPLPRRYEAKGMRRYGFHGLSYAYLLEELRRLGDPAATSGRVILAHLGNGASLAAVRAGACVDTSMGFTPTSGLVMSTRSGDLDPGVSAYLARTEGMSASQFYDLVNHQSGLLGISETSPDMRDLLAREAQDVRAAEAVALFCYQAKKWVGSFAAVLGGLDTLVFAGGIGEHAAPVRARICSGLEFFGLELDAARNEASAAVISTTASRVRVRVLRTDEELMIARSVLRASANARMGDTPTGTAITPDLK